MRPKWQEARREPRSPCAPVRVVEMPQPQGGTSPRGLAPVEERVVQTAMPLVMEPLCAAALHDGSYGDRPKREAQQASIALREDLDHRAWGVVAIDGQSSCQSLPHRQLRQRITRRIADGSLLQRIKQTLRVGVQEQGQVVPTQVGVPPGSPLSPLYRHSSLHRRAPLWQSRGYPAKRGATLHRSADDAVLVCRRSPPPALAACEASATRREGTLNRDQPHVTRVTDGCAFLGCNCVTRTSPSRGQHPIAMFPAQSAQPKMRNRLQSITSRRAPLRPKACVELVHPMGTGWVHSFRHTNASQAFRGLQRFVTIGFRRSLTQRRKGRGVGWQRFPDSTLEALGLVSIGSGLLESTANPAHGVR
jgi:RNA-directed DNA polymerase